MENMTVKQLQDALSKLNPDAPIRIIVRTRTSKLPALELTIQSTMNRDGYETHVNSEYGASITAYADPGVIIQKRKKNSK